MGTHRLNPLARRISGGTRVRIAGLALAGLVTLVATAVDCGGDRLALRSSTLTVACGCDERVLSPAMDANARLLLFLPLVTFDSAGGIEGRLAREWHHSPDYRLWTFHLRSDVRWHDGVAVTARDVKFTVDLWAHPAVAWYGAAGVEETVVLDDSTVAIHFREPTNALQYQPWLVYYPEHLTKHLDPADFYDWEFWTQPVGNGPYRFGRLVPRTAMEFEANADYFAGRPHVDRVVLKFVDAAGAELLSGNVDVLVDANPDEASRLAAEPRYLQYHHYSATTARVIYWRNDLPMFRDRRVRRALTLAINRRELLRLLRFPDTTPIVDGPYTERQLTRGALPAPVPFDPEQARALLDSAGWRDPGGNGVRQKDGEPLRFTLTAAENAEPQMVATYVQSQLRRVGVEMEVQPLDGPALSAQAASGRFEAVLFLTGYPTSWLSRYFGTGKMLGYERRGVPDLIERAERAADPALQELLYAQLTEIFRTDAPAAFLFPTVEFVIAHRRVKGLSSPWRADPVFHIEDVWLEDAP